MRRLRLPRRPTPRSRVDPDCDRDVGAILPLAMVFTIVLSVVTVAAATFATTGLRFSSVVRDRADRLAAAEGGMSYMIEKMRLSQSLCTTASAQNGLTTVVPPSLNGSTIAVTCDRIGALISDVQSWALVVTGKGVPAGQDIFATKAGSGQTKSFGGPVFMADITRLGVDAASEIKDGDLWYTGNSCPVPATPPTIANLTFSPSFLRGPLCTTRTWEQLFRSPTLPPMPSAVNPPSTTMSTGCKVFFPGRYTTAPTFAAQNYFVAGDYYFHDVGEINIRNAVVVGGFAIDENGDGQFLLNPQCDTAAETFPGTGSGATWILGGSSRIYVDNKGELEILRRRQGRDIVSVQAVEAANATGGYMASTVGATNPNENIYESKSGNNADVAIHGMWWTPESRVVLGNVTNTANGQFLGGLIGGYVEVQASASVNALNIRVETSPATGKWLMTSRATKNGRSTTIRAIVDYQPDTAYLAINSWRVE